MATATIQYRQQLDHMELQMFLQVQRYDCKAYDYAKTSMYYP